MSKQHQEKSQDSTPSATGKSAKPAQGGGTPQKSLDVAEDKALPVKAIHFNQVIKWPGTGGAASSIVVGKLEGIGSAFIPVESIFQYKGKFIVNGRFFMPETASAILSYEY